MSSERPASQASLRLTIIDEDFKWEDAHRPDLLLGERIGRHDPR